MKEVNSTRHGGNHHHGEPLLWEKSAATFFSFLFLKFLWDSRAAPDPAFQGVLLRCAVRKGHSRFTIQYATMDGSMRWQSEGKVKTGNMAPTRYHLCNHHSKGHCTIVSESRKLWSSGRRSEIEVAPLMPFHTVPWSLLRSRVLYQYGKLIDPSLSPPPTSRTLPERERGHMGAKSYPVSCQCTKANRDTMES